VIVAGFGCASDQHLTLAALAQDNAEARASAERDACSCSCGKLVCWDFTCSGEGCSSADEHELSVVREPQEGGRACLPAATRLTARLFDEDAEPLVAEAATHGCDELSFLWRGPPADLESRPHRVEISDGRESWSIDDPFAHSTLTVLAPASAVSPSLPVPASVRPGDVIVFSIAPPAELTDVAASIRSPVTHQWTELPVVSIDDRLELSVPSGARPGLYRLQIGAVTLLPASACHGPTTCRGLDVATSFDLRID
jgi:hypothetical protein